MSYCSGEAGRAATQSSTAQALLASSSTQGDKPQETKARIEQNYSKKRIGEGNVALDKDKLAEALSDERKRKAGGDNGDDHEVDRHSKKKRAPEIGTHDVTEEELGEFLVCIVVPGPHI